ncbi:hypothetical protein EJ06DRAFT_189693 [Trichodelitschia bisporula]|uniref:Mei2-like C-terminal RNA recognition motif domain-containing protein n=1 Tax=Trichodelitschia bisporula TaxID=703511 RepID=A0A6G1I7J6_9PEZI|nr:hypothetical protein EJ06DRAFT_189693 [Trichodelitschia bisporula]
MNRREASGYGNALVAGGGGPVFQNLGYAQPALAPMPPSTPVHRNHAGPFIRNAAFQQNDGHFGRNSPRAHVVPERIRQGLDVRTTVMIRNIPNKVDAAMFKDIIDESSWGKYDFSYLRIDFKNQCNVGYAFVNLIKPEYIIGLFDQLVGKRWNVYNSDKVAEMCYATIQGRDCLIEKFRNSSVMCEWAPHRAKLWYTEVDGQLCGSEAPFPGPTNLQKVRTRVLPFSRQMTDSQQLQRSKDNAAEIGLFPPRGAASMQQADRHRSSLYDRGTPHALLDARRLEAQRPIHPQTFAGPVQYVGPRNYAMPYGNGLGNMNPPVQDFAGRNMYNMTPMHGIPPMTPMPPMAYPHSEVGYGYPGMPPSMPSNYRF